MDFDKILHGVGPHKANLNVYFWHDEGKTTSESHHKEFGYYARMPTTESV